LKIQNNIGDFMNRLKQKKYHILILGSIFLVSLVIGSLLMLYLNDNSVKYEKYEFTETEEMHIQAQSGYEIINPYRDYYIFPTRISPYESYHLAEEKLGFYIVGYRNSNLEQYQKNTYQYFKTITWYKFETNKAIPSNIDNMEIVDVIAVVKEKRTKDLFTNFEFELESDKYIRCEYEINKEEVIYGSRFLKKSNFLLLSRQNSIMQCTDKYNVDALLKDILSANKNISDLYGFIQQLPKTNFY
jgi:hypothetical protein